MLSGSLSNDDYPRAAIRAREQGTTIIRFTVGANGRASNCVLWQSSGSALLDGTTCGLVTRRFRYVPAKDAAGRNVLEWMAIRVHWELPANIRLESPVPYSETE